MPPGDDDLIPMFREEAEDRLEQLALFAGRASSDPDALVRARRELHALKGSSRMMGLTEISALCHRAEELLGDPSEESLRELMMMHDRLAVMVAGLGSPPDHDAGADSAASGRSAVESAAGDGVPHEELRVRAEVLEQLADRGARLRLLSLGAGGLVKRLFVLARLAERGSKEHTPREVLATVASSIRELAVEAESGQRRVRRLSERVSDSLLRLQVQPLRPVLLSLARHARELAAELGKEVEVSVNAGDSHLDRRIIRALQEAFIHLVRNAVDHGIEESPDRRSGGKPAPGQVSLRAVSEGDTVRIQVSDDGRGIDTRHIVESAVQRGELPDELARTLSDEEILRLLCLPGLSTRQDASQTSGRGIGLDAVDASVRAVGGDLRIHSRLGRGTTVTVELPTTRRGEKVLVLSIGGSVVALPSSGVRSHRRLTEDMIDGNGEHLTVNLDGRVVPMQPLAELLGLPANQSGTLVEVLIGGVAVVVLADAVVGEEEVFLRPLPDAVGAPSLFDGAALLASGRPVPVLSPLRLGRLAGQVSTADRE